MNTLLSDYQFCQMENELLRNQAKNLKMDINSMSKELTEFFKEKQFIDPYSYHQVGTVCLIPEDQEKILQIINKVIKKN